jgi:hypothetical protein
MKQSRDASYISSFSYESFGGFQIKPNTLLRTFPPSPFGATEDVPRSLVGSRGSFFQPCNVPRRIKGFALRLVSGFLVSGFGFDGHAGRVPLPFHSTSDIGLQASTNFRVFRVFRGSINPPLHVLHDLHG